MLLFPVDKKKCTIYCLFQLFNAFKPNNDQHAISPHSIPVLSNKKAVRIAEMITNRCVLIMNKESSESHPVNDLTNARGAYLILVVQAGTFDR